MFENSNTAHQPKLLNGRSHPSSSRRPAGVSTGLSSTSENLGSGVMKAGSGQHLKNLGKAVGAKVNDLLRRKDPNSLGDIGVTEVNKSAGVVWPCGDTLTVNSHLTYDSFPRLDPPPTTGRKRLPRALKTTQDMMISSDPVVATPEVSDSSCVASPEKTPLLQKEDVEAELEMGEKQEEFVLSEMGAEDENEDSGGMEASKEDPSLLLHSVPDLIHKDNLEPVPRPTCPEARMASTPCKGKAGVRISVSEADLQGSEGPKADEPHPDLLSFE